MISELKEKETQHETFRHECETKHQEMIQLLTNLSDEAASKDKLIMQLQEQIAKSRDKHRNEAARYQELEKHGQRVLSDLIQKEHTSFKASGGTGLVNQKIKFYVKA